jgi:hypothetical protein
MWLTAAILWVTALYFLIRMPKVELSGTDEATSNLRSDATLT